MTTWYITRGQRRKYLVKNWERPPNILTSFFSSTNVSFSFSRLRFRLCVTIISVFMSNHPHVIIGLWRCHHHERSWFWDESSQFCVVSTLVVWLHMDLITYTWSLWCSLSLMLPRVGGLMPSILHTEARLTCNCEDAHCPLCTNSLISAQNGQHMGDHQFIIS